MYIFTSVLGCPPRSEENELCWPLSGGPGKLPGMLQTVQALNTSFQGGKKCTGVSRVHTEALGRWPRASDDGLHVSILTISYQFLFPLESK